MLIFIRPRLLRLLFSSSKIEESCVIDLLPEVSHDCWIVHHLLHGDNDAFPDIVYNDQWYGFVVSRSFRGARETADDFTFSAGAFSFDFPVSFVSSSVFVEW